MLTQQPPQGMREGSSGKGTLEVPQLSLHSSPLISSASSRGGDTQEGSARTGAGKLRSKNTFLMPSAGWALPSTKLFRYFANFVSISAAQ